LPESPRQRAPQRGLPQMVDQVIMRSLKTDPEQRFQTAAEMREALEAALKEPELRRQRRRKLGFAALGAVMASLVAGGALAVKQPELVERANAKLSPMVNYVKVLRQGSAAVEPAPVAKAAAVTPKTPSPVESPAPATPAQDSEMAQAEPVVDIDLDQLAEPEEAEEPAGEAELSAASAVSSSESESEEAAESPEAASDAHDTLEARLVQAEQQMTEGNRIKGYNTIKRLAWKHPKDPRALRAYSEAAVTMKAWGEAYRAAYNWAEVDKSPEARLQLAKLERATSRGNYRRTLEKLLAEYPEHEEASALLGGNGKKTVAQRDD